MHPVIGDPTPRSNKMQKCSLENVSDASASYEHVLVH